MKTSRWEMLLHAQVTRRHRRFMMEQKWEKFWLAVSHKWWIDLYTR